MTIPPNVGIKLRPDIIMYSNSTKQVLILELTVPAEDNIVHRHLDKENKYSKLLDDIKMNKWTGHIFGVEVGSRGYVAKSFGYALQKLGLKQKDIGKLKKDVSLICLRCSYSIYLSRKNEIWQPWEAQHFTAKSRNNRNSAEEIATEITSNEETEVFCGFEVAEVVEASEINGRKRSVLYTMTEDFNTFQGFDDLDIGNHKKINTTKTDALKGPKKSKASIPLVYNQAPLKTSGHAYLSHKSRAFFRPGLANCGIKPRDQSAYDQVSQQARGLINLGNSCYMNSVMQCLNSVAPLVKYFTMGAHLENINPSSSYGGTVAREVGTAFKLLTTGKKGPVSLQLLKNRVGALHLPFSGSEQNDSHEFLMFLLTWLHEDLRGAGLSALQGCSDISQQLTIAEKLTSELSIISLLFEGEHRHINTCNTCQHESILLEPFTVLSLSFSSSGDYELADLIRNYYKACSIDFRCPGCSAVKSTRKTSIHRLPRILVLHLNRFEYNISARKKQNYVDFPLEKLSFREHVSNGGSFSYNLCAVSNHHGTMSGGHYTSYCKPPLGNVWYNCDDRTVTKLRKSIKSSAAYLLFYDSFHMN